MKNKLDLTIPTNWQIISRDALKIIACISMLCDHIGKVFILDLYGPDSFLYEFLRFGVGRIAFPVFCTLFIQGIMYTKNVEKHLIILGIFSLLSEPCYDFASKHTWLEFTHQNVMLSWFIGCVTIAFMRKLYLIYKEIPLHKVVYILYNILIILSFSVVANFLYVDYRYVIAALCGIIFLLWHSHPEWQFWIPGTIVSVVVALCYDVPWAVLAIPFMLFYDGTKIQKSTGVKRYGFYIFYPLHLLILGLIYQFTMV